MYQKLPPSSVSLAGVPEMNSFAEGGAMVSNEDLSSPAEIAALLTQYFMVDSAVIKEKTLNLDDSCKITSAEAFTVLQTVAAHIPAYGVPLGGDTRAKAADTFYSMQHAGQNIPEEDACLWYGSCDCDKLPAICAGVFTTDEGNYWADWIGFLIICVHPDKRTVSYLLGADTD